MAATDGAVLIEVKDCSVEGTGQVIIPRDAVEFACKGQRKGQVKITPSSIGPVSYEPVDGKFPNYGRIFPAKPDEKPTFGFYTSENIKRLEDAIKAFGAARYDTGTNPSAQHILFVHNNKMRVIVMPFRVN